MKTENEGTGNHGKLVTGNQSGPGREEPGFYAVIPAMLLYNPNLPSGAKFLYAAITGLANLRGYCWASNAYFANLYHVDERTVSRWLAILHNAGYIIVSYDYFGNSKRVRQRRISLPPPIATVIEPIPEDSGPEEARKMPPEAGINAPKDTTSGDDKNVITQGLVAEEDFAVKKAPDDTKPGVDKNAITHDVAVEETPVNKDRNDTTSGVDKNAITQNLGDDKNVVDININSYSNTTIPAAAAALGEEDRPTQDGAAAAPCLSEEGEKPPGRPAAAGGAHTRQVQAAAAPVPKNTESPNVPAFKAALEAVNPSLVFDSGFYPRARAWLTRHSLPVDFLSWLYEQCLRKKPSSVRGMFRTLFFAPDMTSFFKSLHTPPPERPLVSCPLCGASHDARDDLCPACGLKKDAQEQDILFHRHLLSLPPDRRAVYENQVRIIFTAGLDFREQKRRLDALHKDFAFP